MRVVSIAPNGAGIAEGGALNHQSLIEKQMLNMSTENKFENVSPTFGNTVLPAVILREIKDIIKKDWDESDWDEWDGKVSFSGVKRMIYGIWNEGKNEKNEDMICWMSPSAKIMYKDLIEKYKHCKKVTVSL